jgi:hypothetical protein
MLAIHHCPHACSGGMGMQRMASKEPLMTLLQPAQHRRRALLWRKLVECIIQLGGGGWLSHGQGWRGGMETVAMPETGEAVPPIQYGKSAPGIGAWIRLFQRRHATSEGGGSNALMRSPAILTDNSRLYWTTAVRSDNSHPQR